MTTEMGRMNGIVIEKKREKVKIDTAAEFLYPKSYSHY